MTNIGTRCGVSGGGNRQLSDLGYRLTGSSDLAERRPHASINFVTAHDGLTLYDLVRASTLPAAAHLSTVPPALKRSLGRMARRNEPRRRGSRTH